MQSKETMFVVNYRNMFHRTQKLMKHVKCFSDKDLRKIQKIVMKDSYNKSKIYICLFEINSKENHSF